MRNGNVTDTPNPKPTKSELNILLTLFDGMDAAVYVADVETYEILFANQTMTRLMGPLEGATCYKALQRREEPCPFCTNEALMADKTRTIVWEAKSPVTGKWYRCTDKALLWTGGRWVRYQMSVDIDDLKKDQIALAQFRAAVDTSADSIFIIEPDTMAVVDVNASACAALERDRAAIVGSPFNGFIDRINGRLPGEAVREAAVPPYGPVVLETAFLCSGGRSFPAEILFRGMPGSVSENREIASPLLVVAAARDITQRKRAETELLAAKMSAEAANRAKNAFLAAMSHELRTPLNAVIGFSEILTERHFGPLNDKQSQFVDDIHMSGRTLLTLIDDILEIIRIESGDRPLTPGPVRLDLLLRQMEMIFREKALEKRLSIESRVDGGLEGMELFADTRALKKILFNLLHNAVKFSHPGGTIRVNARKGGKGIEIRVADSGPGIPPEQAESIFTPFYQATDRPLQHAPGAGLGLAIVKGLVERHGGTIFVETAPPGGGGVFYLTLPTAIDPEIEVD